jgi:hypothetical protein
MEHAALATIAARAYYLDSDQQSWERLALMNEAVKSTVRESALVWFGDCNRPRRCDNLDSQGQV